MKLYLIRYPDLRLREMIGRTMGSSLGFLHNKAFLEQYDVELSWLPFLFLHLDKILWKCSQNIFKVKTLWLLAIWLTCLKPIYIPGPSKACSWSSDSLLKAEFVGANKVISSVDSKGSSSFSDAENSASISSCISAISMSFRNCENSSFSRCINTLDTWKNLITTCNTHQNLQKRMWLLVRVYWQYLHLRKVSYSNEANAITFWWMASKVFQWCVSSHHKLRYQRMSVLHIAQWQFGFYHLQSVITKMYIFDLVELIIFIFYYRYLTDWNHITYSR